MTSNISLNIKTQNKVFKENKKNTESFLNDADNKNSLMRLIVSVSSDNINFAPSSPLHVAPSLSSPVLEDT